MTQICFHVGDITKSGGTEKVALQIANELAKNPQFTIHIISTSTVNERPFFSMDKRIKTSSLFGYQTIRGKKDALRIVWRVRKYIQDNDIKVLVGVDTIQTIFDLPATALSRCKYVAWEHFNTTVNLGKRSRDFGRYLAAKFADATIVLTKEDKRLFLGKYKVKNRLLQIYNPISASSVNVSYNSRSRTIISSGRLTHQKGFDLLIDVAKVVAQKTTDFQWIILGDGEDRNALEQKVQDNSLGELVHFIGRKKDVDKYYSSARMFVLTSRFEGQVLVVLEAKQQGIPVVAFSCLCGPKEMIIDGVNGYLVDDFNIEYMAEKIIHLLDDDSLCREFSQKSTLGMEEFNLNKIVRKWESLLGELLV